MLVAWVCASTITNHLTLDTEMKSDINKEVFAAIAYALHEALGKYDHDQESFVLTIKRTPSTWGLKTQAMRVLPTRQ